MKIHVVHGSGLCSNCFLLESEIKNKMIIVDLGLPGILTNFKLKKAVDKITEKNEDYDIEVFLTHCHVDHVTGSNNLKGYKNVIYSASNLTTEHINERDKVTLVSKYGLKINFEINKIHKNGDLISFDDNKLKVIYSPGHTDGSAVLYDVKTKNLFSGDVVFAGDACGRVDFPTGNKQDMIQSLQNLSQLEIKGLYSGHGEELFHNIQANIINAKKMLEYW
ncbi:MAG: MBL fold metallo-hydrolase [Asgard group archaeon]|nr:MBL fold metallo-hydrolase [Asgard group archaeon]